MESSCYIIHGHRCKASCMFILILVLITQVVCVVFGLYILLCYASCVHRYLRFRSRVQSPKLKKETGQWIMSRHSIILLICHCYRLLNLVRYEVFTVVTMRNAVFWDVMPCGSRKNPTF
jgi:hypothetical protein